MNTEMLFRAVKEEEILFLIEQNVLKPISKSEAIRHSDFRSSNAFGKSNNTPSKQKGFFNVQDYSVHPTCQAFASQ